MLKGRLGTYERLQPIQGLTKGDCLYELVTAARGRPAPAVTAEHTTCSLVPYPALVGCVELTVDIATTDRMGVRLIGTKRSHAFDRKG